MLIRYFGSRKVKLLTMWEPGYDTFVPRFQPKTSNFQLPCQRHISSANYARELFKGSNGSASLLVRTEKNYFGWGLQIFCEWCHKWSSFGAILAHVAWPRAPPLGQSIALKFLLETRLASESFEPLIDFLAFLVQKLWSKTVFLKLFSSIAPFSLSTCHFRPPSLINQTQGSKFE